MLGIPKAQGIWRRISEGEGQDQIYISESSPVADWGWNGKNGGCKTSSEVTAVITLVSFKIWKLWNIESLVARGLSEAFRNAGSPRLPHSTGRHSLLCFSLKITLHTSNWLYLREENLVPLSSQLKLG